MSLYTEAIHRFIQDKNYKIMEDGTVYTCVSQTGHITNHWRLKGITKGRNGYKRIRYGRGIMLWLHRVVYAKFIGPLNDELTINHKDSNPSNNHFMNLEQITQGANNLHSYRIGKKTPVIGNFKLSLNQVKEIRNLHKNGIRACELCRIFKMSKSTMSLIINNKIWKMVREVGDDPTTSSLEN